MAVTKNFVDVIRQKLAENPKLAEAVEAERIRANVAAEIYRARKEAGLSQKDLADRARTKQPVIARLENTDYDGHSLKMVARIAAALGKRVEVRLVDQPAVTATEHGADIHLEPPKWDISSIWEPMINMSQAENIEITEQRLAS